jgi:hypothetical protein
VVWVQQEKRGKESAQHREEKGRKGRVHRTLLLIPPTSFMDIRWNWGPRLGQPQREMWTTLVFLGAQHLRG